MERNDASAARQLGKAEFGEAVLSADRPVLVDFWAEWCGPCRTLGPVIDELAVDYSGQVDVVKINIDEHPETAARYGVRSIPTVMLFDGGEPAETLVGLRPKAEFDTVIARRLGTRQH